MKNVVNFIKKQPEQHTMTINQITKDFFRDMQDDVLQEFNRLMFVNHVKPQDNATVTLLMRQACVNVVLTYQPKKPTGGYQLKLVA